MNWSAHQPIDDRNVDLTEPSDWRDMSMTIEDLQQLQAELGVTVPGFLAPWLLDNPFRKYPGQTRSLVCNRDRLIHDNVEYRRNGYYDRGWPDHLLYIGDDWGGVAHTS